MNLFIPKHKHLHIHKPEISHTREVYENYGVPKSTKNSLSEVNTGSPIFKINTTMDGTKHAIYHVNMIDLLDKVFMRDNLEFISIEQERFMGRFFQQAHVATNIMDNNALQNKNDDPFANMDEMLRELDNFLGSYFGVNYGRFSR